jgi:hypothetical protein
MSAEIMKYDVEEHFRTLLHEMWHTVIPLCRDLCRPCKQKSEGHVVDRTQSPRGRGTTRDPCSTVALQARLIHFSDHHNCV